MQLTLTMDFFRLRAVNMTESNLYVNFLAIFLNDWLVGRVVISIMNNIFTSIDWMDKVEQLEGINDWEYGVYIFDPKFVGRVKL